MSTPSKTYTVEISITSHHEVVVSAEDEEAAKQKAFEVYADNDVVDSHILGICVTEMVQS